MEKVLFLYSVFFNQKKHPGLPNGYMNYLAQL